MPYALAISLLANIGLAIMLLRRTRLWHCRIRFWFLKKPDFAQIEERVKRILAEPEFSE